MNQAQNNYVELIHPEIRALSSYHVQPSAGLVKLDAMESPYGFSEELARKWSKHIQSVEVNLYPDPHSMKLKSRLRRIFEIPDHLELTIGNGSDDLLQLVQLAVGGVGRKIMSPQPSFVMYHIIAQYTRASYVGFSLNQDFTLDSKKWLSQVELEKPDCVFLSYPNNPTGDFFDAVVIEQTANLIDGLVVVDEAYFAYSKKSMLPLVDRLQNLIVVRTLSKSSLAGLRIGYMISQPQWFAEFEKLRLPYNVGVLAQESAVFALDHWDEMSASIQRVLAEKERVESFLNSLSNLRVYSSSTNFVTVRFFKQKANDIHQGLIDRGVLVKNLDGSHPVLENCLRFSIGSPDENSALLQALDECLD